MVSYFIKVRSLQESRSETREVAQSRSPKTVMYLGISLSLQHHLRAELRQTRRLDGYPSAVLSKGSYAIKNGEDIW